MRCELSESTLGQARFAIETHELELGIYAEDDRVRYSFLGELREQVVVYEKVARSAQYPSLVARLQYVPRESQYCLIRGRSICAAYWVYADIVVPAPSEEWLV
jgi:hypothetical protein